MNAMQAMLAAKALGIPVLVRAEPWLGDRDRSGPTLAAKHLFFKVLRGLLDGALPIGTLNAAYWRHYLGEDFPLHPMPYAVDNHYFQSRCMEARETELMLALGFASGLLARAVAAAMRETSFPVTTSISDPFGHPA